VNVFFLILIFFVVGMALRYFFSPPQRLTDNLNFFVIHLAFPAVILTIVPFIELSVDVLIPLVSYWGLIPLAWILSKVLARLFSWSRDIECVL